MQEMQEMWVWSLDWEDPLEEEMATHSSILAWKIPWTEEPWGLQSMGSQRLGHVWAIEHSTHTVNLCSDSVLEALLGVFELVPEVIEEKFEEYDQERYAFFIFIFWELHW